MPLDTLFTCERFGRLTHRACRRRQLELRLVTDEKAGKKKPGGPAYELCASGTCVKGTEIAAALEAEDVSTATCPKCGAAFVGSEADEPCPACAPARVEARARRVEVSTRIWAGEVPNTAIAPPARSDIGLGPAVVQAVAARVAAGTSVRRPRLAPAPSSPRTETAEPEAREVAPAEKRVEPAEVGGHATSPGKPGAPPAPTAPVNAAPPPATPAEEETMPKGQRSEPCPECGTKALRCKSTCPTKSGKAAAPKPAAKEKASPAPVKLARAEAARPAKPRARAIQLRGRGSARPALDLEALDGAGLRALRADLREQLADVEQAIRDRAERLAAERQELLEDLGEERERGTGTEG